MSRKLRITFRNGDVRMGDFPAGRTLVELWDTFKRDRAIIGDRWCAQFDFVAMIEVVEMATDVANEPLNEQREGPTQADWEKQARLNQIDDNVKRLAVLAGAGIFKPPGEA